MSRNGPLRRANLASLLKRLGKRAALRTPVLRAVVTERDELRWRVSRLESQVSATTALQATPPLAERDKWFWDHYTWAVAQMTEFLAAGGISLAEQRVADVGCGDGIIDLGLAHRERPARLVCFDIVPTDTGKLLARAASQGVPAESLPGSDAV